MSGSRPTAFAGELGRRGVSDNQKTNAGPVLQAAREEIAGSADPAYIKDGELRYVAVSDAYAELCGCMPADLIGRRDPHSPEDRDRDEKERRCLVFGGDQTAVAGTASSAGRYRLKLHRLEEIDGSFFVVARAKPAAPALPDDAREALTPRPPGGADAGDFRDLDLIKAIEAFDEPVAVVGADGRILFSNARHREAGLAADRAPAASAPSLNVLRAVAAPSSRTLAGNELLAAALDEVQAGIVIYDGNDVLQFANRRMKEMFEGHVPPLERGTQLRAVLETMYDTRLLADGGTADREEWVAERIRLHHRRVHETEERLADGRWIKAISRRIGNAMIGIRIDVTEAKERGFELDRKEEEIDLFKAVFDELPNSTYVKDEAFRLVYANRAYCDLTGWRIEDVIGKSDVDLFGEEGEALMEADRKVFATGRMQEQEETLSSRSGERFELVSRKARVTTADGRTFLIGTTADITGQKRRHRELVEARRLADGMRADVESVIEALEMSVVVVDADNRIEMMNGACLRIWGQDAGADLIGQPLRCLLDARRHDHVHDVADADWEDYVGERLAEIRTGNVAARELELMDGRTLVYSVHNLSSDRRMICHFDVSSQKASERQIAEAKAELEATSATLHKATSAMAQGLCIYDSEIRLTNQAFHDLVGLGPEEIRPGVPFADFIARIAESGAYGDAAATERAVGNILADGNAGRPHVVERRTSTGRWLRIDAKPDGDGAMIATYTDITEAREREEELKRLLQRAELADKAKSEFLANMSHEIRTPMNGVLGMAELLARSNLDTRQRTFTDVIVKSGNALLTIINDILDFSKIDAGRMVLESDPFDLAESIADVAALVSSRVAEKDIELIVRAAPDLPQRVIGDVGRVRQIVTNLLGNAAKFTEMGHVLVDVSAAVENETAAIAIRVEDTGIGIPADKLESIFEKFSQVDGSSTRRHEGSGLGLSIASGLVDMMGGRIEVGSEYGRGSVFTVHLALPVDRAAPKPKRVPVDVTGARVLVIDDNPVNRDILMEQLGSWKFDGCAVESGAEGLEVLKAADSMGVAVDLVILDYHMPGMNGAETALKIRSRPETAGTPIVMLTSADIRLEERGFASLRIDAHLMKPARSSLLLETIVETLQRAGARAEADVAPAATNKPAVVSTDGLPAAAEPSGTGARSALDVLVAEDNEVNQIVFSQILDELDVAYQIVRNGQEALDAFVAKSPRMILMDVSMPIMNGHEAARAIRRHETETGGHVPIVGVTAHALKGDRDRCIDAGMDDYMSKPISPEKLGEKVRGWLGPARALERA